MYAQHYTVCDVARGTEAGEFSYEATLSSVTVRNMYGQHYPVCDIARGTEAGEISHNTNN